MDFTDNQYVQKRISPLFQRLVKPNEAEQQTQELENETKNTVFMMRELLAARKINPEILRVATRPAELQEKLAEKCAEIAEKDLQIAALQHALSDLQHKIDALEATQAPSSPPPPSTVPALLVLDSHLTMDRASVRLKKQLMVMTDDDAPEDDVKARVGEAKYTIQTWYNYRRGSIPLPTNLETIQREAIELMDAIYLSFNYHDVGRKHVQDMLNAWWKSVYEHGKVTLQGKDDPTVTKISFNSKPS